MEGDDPCRQGSRRSVAASRLHDDLRGRDGRSVGRVDRPKYEDAFAIDNGTRRGRARPVLVCRRGCIFDGHLLTR